MVLFLSYAQCFASDKTGKPKDYITCKREKESTRQFCEVLETAIDLKMEVEIPEEIEDLGLDIFEVIKTQEIRIENNEGEAKIFSLLLKAASQASFILAVLAHLPDQFHLGTPKSVAG